LKSLTEARRRLPGATQDDRAAVALFVRIAERGCSHFTTRMVGGGAKHRAARDV